MQLTISLPDAVAQDLLDSRVCLAPLSTRADPATVAAAVAIVGFAADACTVLVSAGSALRFARGLVRSSWGRQSSIGTTAVTICITTPDGARFSVAVTGLDDERAAALIAQTISRTCASSG
jgi:hypothetical protein